MLIEAARGIDGIADSILRLLDDAGRDFVSSVFVRLEVLPKAIFYRQDAESRFYRTFFEGLTQSPPDFAATIDDAYKLAGTFGLSAMDALHVASAIDANAREFITTEKPNKPIYRVSSLIIVPLSEAVASYR